MKGILSVAGHVPRYPLSGKALGAVWGGGGAGERAVSYPRRHLCWQCSSKKLADYKISRRGKVFTFTKDHLVPNSDPPTVMVSADLEGGGRFYGQLTDYDPATVGFEMPVELCFRRIHEGEGFISYFWKFRPA